MKKVLFFTILFFPLFLFAEDFNLEFPAATKERREKYKADMLKYISEEMNAFKLKRNEREIKKSLESMQILNYFEDDGYDFLKLALKDYPAKSGNFYTAVFETIFTLYETGFELEMETILTTTTNPKHFVIATHFLLRIFPEKRLNYLETLQKRYKNYEKIPSLKLLSKYLEISPSEYLEKRPSLNELFSHKYGKDNFIVFSLQRRNRDFPGLCIIKKPDGSFLRRIDGSIFAISQLARSISNLPSYVVNGNTPQGIFSIQDIHVANNTVIGPTPAIFTALPFEISFGEYFHTPKKSGKWNLNSYLDILPSSWRDYFPIQEAFIAGEVGRGLIYAHGTTVDTEFYRDYSYYPNTPTKGCLSSKEIWSKRSGKCLYSDQVFLNNAVKSLAPSQGYMIVVDLDQREMPVTLNEILMDILEAEGN